LELLGQLFAFLWAHLALLWSKIALVADNDNRYGFASLLGIAEAAFCQQKELDMIMSLAKEREVCVPDD
jgi:hypothetical protein